MGTARYDEPEEAEVLYRKKQIEVQAWRNSDRARIPEWLEGHLNTPKLWKPGAAFHILTSNGDALVMPGDWVLLDVRRKPYPVTHEIFLETYEPVPAPETEAHAEPEGEYGGA